MDKTQKIFSEKRVYRPRLSLWELVLLADLAGLAYKRQRAIAKRIGNNLENENLKRARRLLKKLNRLVYGAYRVNIYPLMDRWVYGKRDERAEAVLEVRRRLSLLLESL